MSAFKFYVPSERETALGAAKSFLPVLETQSIEARIAKAITRRHRM